MTKEDKKKIKKELDGGVDIPHSLMPLTDFQHDPALLFAACNSIFQNPGHPFIPQLFFIFHAADLFQSLVAFPFQVTAVGILDFDNNAYSLMVDFYGDIAVSIPCFPVGKDSPGFFEPKQT